MDKGKLIKIIRECLMMLPIRKSRPVPNGIVDIPETMSLEIEPAFTQRLADLILSELKPEEREKRNNPDNVFDEFYVDVPKTYKGKYTIQYPLGEQDKGKRFKVEIYEEGVC